MANGGAVARCYGAVAGARTTHEDTWHSVRILIVDDHSLFGAGLRLLLLSSAPGGEIVCCETGAAALALAEQTEFDLVLLDWNLGSGISGEPLLAALKVALPNSRVVIISGENGAAVVRRSIEGGAAGFVPKESSPALLIDALSLIAHGGVYLPLAALGERDRARAAAQSSAAAAGTAGGAPGPSLLRIAEAFPQLTSRHVDVLDRLARGMSNKQIARALDISEGTVKQHLNAIFRELDVTNRTEAVYLMATRGVRFDQA
jgi:DNA-binding NarL/FixJ family response regulator